MTASTLLANANIDRMGLQLARRLNEHALDLPHDITERLRAARVKAISQRKREPVWVSAPQWAGAGGPSMGSGDEGLNLWSKIASALPLIALLVGLATIHVLQTEHRANEIASLDAELLIDELPPAAYADPGFLVFLKSSPPESKAAD